MVMYYLSAVEYIKNRPFEVLSPAFYLPGLPKDIANPPKIPIQKVNRWKMVATNRRPTIPVRQAYDPNQLERGAFSIEIMLDMHRKGIEFRLLNEEDTVEILDALDRYLISLKYDVETGNEDVITYAKLVISWRKEVYKHYYRYMKTHPVALANLYPNNDPKKNIFHLMSSVGVSSDDSAKLDPLTAKAFPPYELNDLIPKHDNVLNEGQSIESSLGLSQEGSSYDDGKDFDFDDFIKR